MTTAITAVIFFRGNFGSARKHLKDSGMTPTMLGKSRFNRRLHRIRDLSLTVFLVLGETWKDLNAESIYSKEPSNPLWKPTWEVIAPPAFD